MNWVGGSRNRLVMRNDARKQREFFEKRKMQQKLRNMGMAAPESPGATGSGSMDLVTLFIVNQIAAKKDNNGPPKLAVLGGSKRRCGQLDRPLALPMSPCSPSQLSLVESQPRYSDQGARKRGHVIPQGFKCRQLSPVLESAFSDNSAPDYLPPLAAPHSPFSSTSSASSGPGMFPPKPNLQPRGHKQMQLPPPCSPPPWDTSALEQIKFQPFSQPRGMADNMPWSRGSNPPCFQLETPTAVLFGSPEPGRTAARDPARRGVSLSLNQPEDNGPMLDFTLSQSGTGQQSEVDVFRGFSREEYERDDIVNAKSKIYLREGTPVTSSTPQTVPDSRCVGMELSNCSDAGFSCPGHNTSSMNGCGYSPGCSCRGGYLSSDSDHDEDYCRPCLQAAAPSYMEQAWCADTTNRGSQRTLEQHGPRTPLMKPNVSFRADQKLVENVARPDKTSGSDGPQAGSGAETRDAGTQTVDIPVAETCDASTQCKAPDIINPHLPPVDVSVRHAATGRQTHAAAEPRAASPGSAGSGGKHTPWSKKKSEAGFLSDCCVTSQLTADSSDGKVSLHTPKNHFLDALSTTHIRGSDNEEGRDVRGQQEKRPVMKDLLDGGGETATSAARVNRPSEEVEALQEIADILLLLQQRKEG